MCYVEKRGRNTGKEICMEQIRAEKLTLGYGRKDVVKAVDLTIRKGEFLSIIGPSGVGKSTLLMDINATTSILGGKLNVLGNDVDPECYNQVKVQLPALHYRQTGLY